MIAKRGTETTGRIITDLKTQRHKFYFQTNYCQKKQEMSFSVQHKHIERNLFRHGKVNINDRVRFLFLEETHTRSSASKITSNKKKHKI